MKETKRPKFEELLEGKVMLSLINEPIEPEVLTARERADRRWGMEERKEPTQ